MQPYRHSIKTRDRANERGIALLLCIFALLLLTGIAVGMMYMTDTETAINQNYRDSQVAYFAAKAGVNEAIARLRATGANNIPFPTAMPTLANGQMLYIINKKSAAESVLPWDPNNAFADPELCKEGLYASVANNGVGIPCGNNMPGGTAWFTQYNSVSPMTSTAGALDYKWVRISLKGNGSAYPYYVNNSNASGTLATQVCSDGSSQSLLVGATCETSLLSPVWMITSLAVTQNGARRILQTELVKVQMPPLPGALTLDGPGSQLTPPYDAPNSNNFFIKGTPPPSCTTGTAKPAVVTTDSSTQNQVITAIPSNRRDHYTGTGASPDVEVILPNNLPTSWQTPEQAEAVANMLKSAAAPGNIYTGAQTNINIGSQTTPQITFVDGDLTMTGATRGGGVLVVTGTLTMSGNSGFYGVILLIGKGVFQAQGGGSGEYDGAMLVAKTRDASGNLLSTMGNPVVDWSGGGGNGIWYDPCAINNVQNFLGYKSLAARELMY